MRRLWTNFLIILLLAALAAAPAGSANYSPKLLTGKDNGKTLEIRVGERFTLDLRNPASGGFAEISPVFDPGVIRLVSQDLLPPLWTPEPKFGDFGRLVMVFEAVAAGNTDLTINVIRPRGRTKAPLPFMKIAVKVRD
jgi:predicted secreted protein